MRFFELGESGRVMGFFEGATVLAGGGDFIVGQGASGEDERGHCWGGVGVGERGLWKRFRFVD